MPDMTGAPRRRGFATRAIHDGYAPDPQYGAVMPPIHLATTFEQDGVGMLRGGFDYSRSGNPTRQVLEDCLASLEGSEYGFAFASGLAATTSLLMLFDPGDHIIVTTDVYGGTFRLFHNVLSRFGLVFSAVDLRDGDALDAAFTERTRLVWAESPTNPLLQITDVHALADRVHARGALLCVDNTFASPYLQQPLALGADVVMHSTTKYLAGHSDVVGGALLLSEPALAERVRFQQKAIGAVPSPFDCWLLLRGVKTLAVRMERHCANAMAVAQFLDTHPAVKVVHYPGLPAHPGHDIARRQMRGFSGIVSFEVEQEDAALAVLGGMELFTLAESLGAVESLAEHPGLMTHSSIPADVRRAGGLGDGLIRLSVGIEDADDLIADLDQALAAGVTRGAS